MVIENTLSPESLPAELLPALFDLAKLARLAGSIEFEELGEVASALLKRLLQLCEAEQGALLLSREHDHAHSYDASSAFRALALQNIGEEDAQDALTAFASGKEMPTNISCWITYRIDLGRPEAGNIFDSLDSMTELRDDNSVKQPYVLLILGWPGGEKNEHIVQDARRRVPWVANAIASIVESILLAERVHELETSSVREALYGMELLKAELLGTVSHELRSPLASIKGYAATLIRHERRLSREERHQFLLAINEASDRLEGIIERLLEISQLETGQVTIELAPVDVVHLADEAIAALKERINVAAPAQFVFQLRLQDAAGKPTEDVPLILADQRRLREVLDNLLENAIKFSPDGGCVQVTIRPVNQTEGEQQKGHSEEPGVAPQRMLEICVSDMGMGIPTEHLERIFDRFHRVDTRLTREVNGLGLGLTICKRIVELHHGVIWAQSDPEGKGSAFYVRLPLDPQPLE
ncbi:MAG TPA: ATP-binding protein [Ktedonobacteraceae bacterium]|jgi:signal transduction histidine kinase|nr:ATP-binding protein [Ktedonobacteraceae bacterium]